MRKFVLIAAAAITLCIGATPAAADAPVTIEESVTFEDVQPCSGELVEITLNFVDRVHADHPNNFVVNSEVSGSMSDGSTLVKGTRHFNENATGLRANLNDIWVNEATGDRFQVVGVLVVKFDDDVPKVESLRFTCVGR